MGRLSILSTLMGTSLATGARRLKRGPLRPGWSFKYEATVAFMKATHERIIHLDAPAQRAEMELLSLPSSALKRVRREPVDAGGVPAEWFTPPGATGDEVVLYLHGGSYVFGSTRTHGDLIARIALGTGVRVLGLNYRLAPEHPFPAPVEDTLLAYRWLMSNGVKPARVAFCGDSAGGGLAIAALVAMRDGGALPPAGAVLIAPWVDLECSGESVVAHERFDLCDKRMLLHWAKWYVGDADVRNPLVSPYHADLHELPPLFVHVGGVEMQHDDGVRITEKARAAGVKVHLEEWPEMVHNFQTFGEGFPEAVRGTAKLCEHLRSVLGEAEARSSEA
ncbi:acetyl esterase/lipase [Archangium gephyra]|uniref:6-hexanolactone hydrolase n=1 Tax=Archangium gephyra TaxID=48 RepID=A0AAC8TAW4_9BACT|nr:alpha/beta hydrolase [Archangium gephyra]AKI99201.1 6-hexanolactone hydrolase [Archangium gephyra]REG31105.1 acetyl esterase/lipase [Archangium gephyra]